jgi:sporulation protein YlmC with PRC-barrel domain
MSRVPLSETGEWQLKNREQDIRGHRVLDASGAHVGTVDEMIVNTSERRVDSIVLDDGREIPASDIRIADNAVYISADAATAAGGTVTVYDGGDVVERAEVSGGNYDAHADDFRTHYAETYSSAGHDFSTYEPAYRYGYDAAYDDAYRNRTYQDAEADLRQGYSSRYPDRPYDDVGDAVRYGYTRARRGRR